MNRYEFAQMVDMVSLAPTTTIDEVDNLINDAIKYSLYSIGCPYCYHPYVVKKLKECGKYGKINLLGGGGFPDGNWPTDVKLNSIAKCMEVGCNEIDLTTNLGWIKSCMWDEYIEEVRKTRSLTRGLTMKAIIHSPQLTYEEIVKVCEILINEKVDFVKTDTGRSPMPTDIEQVKMIKFVVGDNIRIKASGGIRCIEDVIAIKDIGVSRFGISRKSAIKIIEALPEI